MKEDIIMSKKEAKRVSVMEDLKSRKITQIEAGSALGISDRQVRRIFPRYLENGLAGLVHKNRGRKSNRKTSQAIERKTISIIRDKYPDFKPTLAQENL